MEIDVFKSIDDQKIRECIRNNSYVFRFIQDPASMNMSIELYDTASKTVLVKKQVREIDQIQWTPVWRLSRAPDSVSRDLLLLEYLTT